MILTDSGILVYEGGIYPVRDRHVWVQSLLAKQVRFFTPPYEDAAGHNMGRKTFFRVLAASWEHGIDRLEKILDLYGDATPGFYLDLRDHYAAVGRGERGRTWSRESIRMARLKISYHGKGNGLVAFDAVYPHAVIEHEVEAGSQTLTIQVMADEAARLRRQIDQGEVAGFCLSQASPCFWGNHDRD